MKQRTNQDYTNPQEMSDADLRAAYKEAAEYGPLRRLRQLKTEIVSRWIA